MHLFTTITGLDNLDKLVVESKELSDLTLGRLRAVMEKMVYLACKYRDYPDGSHVWDHQMVFSVIYYMTHVSTEQALCSIKLTASTVSWISERELLDELSELLDRNEDRYLCRKLLTWLSTYIAEEIKQFVDKIVVNHDFSGAKNWLLSMNEHNANYVTTMLNDYLNEAIVKMKSFLELSCEILKDKGMFAIPDKVVDGNKILFVLEHRCI